MDSYNDQSVFKRLYSIGKRLTSSLRTEDVLHSILECAIEELNGDLGWISLTGDDSVLKTVTSYGIDRDLIPDTIPYDRGITGMVARTGTIHYTGNVQNEADFIRVRDNIRSELAVPLKKPGSDVVLGVFNVESSRPDAFSQEDRTLVSAFSEQAAIAVEHARQHSEVEKLFKESTARLERKIHAIRVVSEVTSYINSSLDIDTVLNNIIEKTKEITEGASCQLIIREEDTGKLIIHTPFPLNTGLSEGSEVDPDTGITGWVVRNRKTLNIPDVSQDKRYQCWIPDTQSEIAIPLIKEDALIGVLNIESPEKNNFDTDMVEILEILTAHATTAIVNASLFAKYKRTRERLEFSHYMASVGEFASELIHWFGNKAGLIIGCSENIKAEVPDNESVMEDIDIITHHMSEVFKMKQRILGKTSDEPLEEISIPPLVQETCKDFSDITFSLHDIPADLICNARRSSLKQVLHTIIENSIEAAEDLNNITIEISAFSSEGKCIIIIRDNGPGFPREELPHLFKPFFSTKDGSSSTGMGLWLSYRMLRTMNGNITVEGDRGKGLAFTIELER